MWVAGALPVYQTYCLYAMGQAVTVANASGGKLYVKVQSSFQVSEKADLVVGGSTPSTSADGSATGKIDVEVALSMFRKTFIQLVTAPKLGVGGRTYRKCRHLRLIN